MYETFFGGGGLFSVNTEHAYIHDTRDSVIWLC